MKKILTCLCTFIIVFYFSVIVCLAYYQARYNVIRFAPNYISTVCASPAQPSLDFGIKEFKVPENIVKRNKIKVSKTEFRMFAYTVEMEAHDLSLEHKQAVAKVIVNRLKHKNFNYKSIKEVVQAKNQFNGYKNYKRQKFHPNLDTFIACKQALDDALPHLNDDMIYFYNPKISAKRHARFFEKKELAMTLDGHRFFLSK